MPSSSSSSSSKHDVFLSFRGEDTRNNFTSHLFAALSRKKINTFMDEDINKGDKISRELLNAVIEESKISVIIFSKDYASSKWCLDELVKIVECKKMNGQIVIPVFYHVHPSDVGEQIGSFGDAFIQHENNFRKMPEKVQNWRDALTEASYLAGHESAKIRREADLVDVIVNDVLNKLEDFAVSTDLNGLAGINSRIEQVKSLLCIGSSDFRIVGIWGMGGVGKTTLAEAIFKQISSCFEGKCFMANVREKLERGSGLEQLQQEFFSNLLGENLEKRGPNIPPYTKKRLRRMKVFIVLDDVNKFEQLEYLVGGLNRFGRGSKIIVTTRDKQVLDKYRVDIVYNMEGLNYQEAHEHFCNFAFTQNYCPEDFMELTNRVIDFAKGNPLALKVLGSFLRQKSKIYWKNILDNIKLIFDPDIYDVLKISYDELSWKVKKIFLDIACFFKGYDKDYVTSISGDPSSILFGFDVLVDKSLITISYNRLEMHDLLQEMGQEIVCQECQEEPGKRSRLWYHKDIQYVLNKNKGTAAIEGIFLDLSKIRELHLNSRVFANMSNLRLLKFYKSTQFDVSDTSGKLHLPEGLEYFPDELKYLYWYEYPLKNLPVNFIPNNLIKISLPYSKVQELWREKKEASKLKTMDLWCCHDFTKFPDPLETPNLENIFLFNCINLSQIPSSIQNLKNLHLLCFTGCKSLSSFPRDIHFSSPIAIDFSACNLTEFPQISGNIIYLNLEFTKIEEVPSSIERLTGLEKLNLECCRSLTGISTSICKLKSLRSLNLFGCSNLKSFPEILEQMENLKCLHLDSTGIEELPSSIELLIGLTELTLSDCYKLGSLPENLGNLKSLKYISGDKSAISQIPPSITYINKLEKVVFYGCRDLELPLLSGLSNLKEIRLSGCNITVIPQDIGCLSSLRILDVRENDFESLPTSIKQLSELKYLYLNGCRNLQSIPELPQSLRFLCATACERLESLPELPKSLESLDASLLETLCQSSNAFSWVRIGYILRECPKLREKANDILADSQLIIQHMAIALLKLLRCCENEFAEPARISDDDFDDDFILLSFYEKESPRIGLYLPGNGIPEWFSNQSLGSSITIQLPKHYCNRNFVGFALCAVFGFEDAEDLRFKVICRYRFGKKTLPTNEHFVDAVLSRCTFIESHEVFLGFDPCWNVRLPNDDRHNAVSIDFYAECTYSQQLVKWPKVKCCGVCPVYAHSNESPPSTFTVNMLPPTEEECTL